MFDNKTQELISVNNIFTVATKGFFNDKLKDSPMGAGCRLATEEEIEAYINKEPKKKNDFEKIQETQPIDDTGRKNIKEKQ